MSIAQRSELALKHMGLLSFADNSSNDENNGDHHQDDEQEGCRNEHFSTLSYLCQLELFRPDRMVYRRSALTVLHISPAAIRKT